MKYKLITGLVIVCLIFIFIIQNSATVEIRVFFWTITMSRVFLMLILMLLGMLAGWLLKGYVTHKGKDDL